MGIMQMIFYRRAGTLIVSLSTHGKFNSEQSSIIKCELLKEQK